MCWRDPAIYVRPPVPSDPGGVGPGCDTGGGCVKLDDHMMTVLTGLVVAVVLGTLIQESDTISRVIGGRDIVHPNDDVFFVRAEGTQLLDVTANDRGVDASMPVRVVDGIDLHPAQRLFPHLGGKLVHGHGADVDDPFRVLGAEVEFRVHRVTPS